jgi:hypothetical protein
VCIRDVILPSSWQLRSAEKNRAFFFCNQAHLNTFTFQGKGFGICGFRPLNPAFVSLLNNDFSILFRYLIVAPMALEIKEVRSKKDIREFAKFPLQLFKGSPYWVPQITADEIKLISRDANPAFDFCDAQYWLAYKEGELVGRIGGIINHRYNEKIKKNCARFSMIDFVDDAEVAKLLLETVENWARSKGAELLHGPFGFTDMDPEGMLVEGFEEMGTIATIYNYPYYPKYMEQNGYEKEVDWVEYELVPPQDIPEKVERIAQIALERNKLKVLKFKKVKDLLPYAPQIFEVLNECYEDLHGFVSLTDKQINMYIKQYFGFVVPEYIPVIVNEQNRVVAFGITMPSLSKAFQKAKGNLFPFGFIHILRAMKKNDRVDLYLTGVRPDYQDKGVNAILMVEMNKVYIKNNIKKVESNPELETNSKVQAQWRFYDKRQHRRRRCFVKVF